MNHALRVAFASLLAAASEEARCSATSRDVAHELVHYAQNQKFGAQGAALKAEVSRSSDQSEVEADALADRIVSGESVEVKAQPSSGARSSTMRSPRG